MAMRKEKRFLMKRLISCVFFFPFFLSLGLRASDTSFTENLKIKPYGDRHGLVKALADAVDFSDLEFAKKVIKLMTNDFAVPRKPGTSAPNLSKEFFLRQWGIAKEKASNVPHAQTCLDLLRQGYQGITYFFDDSEMASVLDQTQIHGTEVKDELEVLTYLPGHSPLIATLTRAIDFSKLSQEKLQAIIVQVPFKCSIDESVEHDPLLQELKLVYQKNSISFLISALEAGSFCVRTSITPEDIREYKKNRMGN
jgi:hypothetical protein